MTEKTWTNDELHAWWPNVPLTHLPQLADACERFGLDPDPDAVQREVLAVAHKGNPKFFEPPAVVIVTGGGQKLRWPMDAQTEWTLRHQIFFAFKRRGDEWTDLPLPEDLTLPATIRNGIPVRQPGQGQ